MLASQSPALLWALALGCFTVVELVTRRRVPWRVRAVNLANGALVLLVIFLVGPLVAGAVHKAHDAIGLRLDPPYSVDAIGDPFLAALAFLLAYDFGYYWFHRLEHTSTLLWRIHAVHHSETSLNATSYVRQHVLENVMQSLCIMVPLLLVLRAGPLTFAWVAVLSAFFQFFAHADIRATLRPIARVVITPQVHRLHHSSAIAESNSNFASLFPLWDMLFGTYRPPVAGIYPATGLHSGEKLQGLWPLLMAPFRRQR